jgi:hypothetical protein
MSVVTRATKVPTELGLPSPQEPTLWLHELTARLTLLLRRLTERANLLLDGYILTVTTLPAAGAEHRGRMVILRGGPGVADRLFWCRKTVADAIEWREVI